MQWLGCGGVTPSVAAGRALYLLEHPGVDPSVWDLTDEPTRAWYVTRAQPIADACLDADKET